MSPLPLSKGSDTPSRTVLEASKTISTRLSIWYRAAWMPLRQLRLIRISRHLSKTKIAVRISHSLCKPSELASELSLTLFSTHPSATSTSSSKPFKTHVQAEQLLVPEPLRFFWRCSLALVGTLATLSILSTKAILCISPTEVSRISSLKLQLTFSSWRLWAWDFMQLN